MAHMIMAYTVVACIVVAYVVLAYAVMTYIGMAYIHLSACKAMGVVSLLSISRYMRTNKCRDMCIKLCTHRHVY